ncbi:caffeoylshikimate esterase-like protein [Tanacetum coccineum]
MPPPPPPPPSFFWGETPEEEYYASQGVRNSKLYYETPNGKIFTQSWHPLDPNQPIKATVFMTHGFTNDTSWSFQKICIAYAKWGYAVYAADLIGHGRSDGLHGYIGDMEKAAATSLSYFSDHDMWTGLIFASPLFVIPEDMIPSKAVWVNGNDLKLHLTMYGLLFGLADTWAAMPDPRRPTMGGRDVQKLKIKAMNPKRYSGKPRVGTMREVVKWTNYLQQNFDKVKVPFLTAHGTADPMACPSGSEMLYEKASTAKEDKCLKLYEGMFHSLINGESDEAAEVVLADMKGWIDEMSKKFGPKSIDINDENEN